MKVLFLDFDGVLNTDRFVRVNQQFGLCLEPSKLMYLKEIVNKTNAHIVIHSSWRMYFDKTGSHYICKYMNDEFMKYGLVIDDCTRINLRRKESIEDYIVRHDLKEYVIVDDMYLSSTLIDNHFIKTDAHYGITDQIKNEIIKMLGANY